MDCKKRHFQNLKETLILMNTKTFSNLYDFTIDCLINRVIGIGIGIAMYI